MPSATDTETLVRALHAYETAVGKAYDGLLVEGASRPHLSDRCA